VSEVDRGAWFRPGAAAPVLRTSAAEMVDLTVGCDDLWHGSALPVGERPAVATSPQDAARLLEAEVLRLVRAATDPDPVVRSAVGMLVFDPANAVRALTTELHISDSQLRRRPPLCPSSWPLRSSGPVMKQSRDMDM
jgi:hypothetical protein